MSIALRREADWPALVALWVESWSDAYPAIDFSLRRDWLVRHLSELEARGAVTLCLFEAPDDLLGFVTINPATGWLDQICVARSHIGNGAGAALMAAAREASPQGIRLDVNADNARAIGFYERQGFTSAGPGPDSMSGRPTLVMEWRALQPQSR